MEHVSSVLPTGKFPEKVENLKRWDCFPERNFVFHLSVSPSLYQFQAATVGQSDVPGFTTKWNNFLPIGNSTFATTEISGFFRKWKAPPKVSLNRGQRERSRSFSAGISIANQNSAHWSRGIEAGRETENGERYGKAGCAREVFL